MLEKHCVENDKKKIIDVANLDIGKLLIEYSKEDNDTRLILSLCDIDGVDHTIASTKISNDGVESNLYSICDNNSVCNIKFPLNLRTYEEDDLLNTILCEKYEENFF